MDLDNTFYQYDDCHQPALSAVASLLATKHDIDQTSFQTSYETAKKIVKQRTQGHGASHSRLLYFFELLHQEQLFYGILSTL